MSTPHAAVHICSHIDKHGSALCLAFNADPWGRCARVPEPFASFLEARYPKLRLDLKADLELLTSMDSVSPETTSGGVFLLPVSRSKAVQIAEEISDAFPGDQYETVAAIMVRAEQRRDSGLPSCALLYEHNTESGLLHLV
ncbi:MAG: hypothetical protein J0L58_10630 [Burkholderiales bacterium]|nr:hypothetical protein [Burkholderiales bacterium]